MSEMVERVASALRGEWDKALDTGKPTNFRGLARAAIKAMSENAVVSTETEPRPAIFPAEWLGEEEPVTK